MNIKIVVENLTTGRSWPEGYKKDFKTEKEAKTWAKNLIKWFNGTCLPGESKRKLLEVAVMPEDDTSIEYCESRR